MNKTELEAEVNFGLENLQKIYERVVYISTRENEDPILKVPALAYECLGYYNAIEHLMLRFIKFLKIPVSMGPFSHKKTLIQFFEIAQYYEITVKQHTRNSILELMAFRHVATKLYGFLIDAQKLNIVANRIRDEHQSLFELMQSILTCIDTSTFQSKSDLTEGIEDAL